MKIALQNTIVRSEDSQDGLYVFEISPTTWQASDIAGHMAKIEAFRLIHLLTARN